MVYSCFGRNAGIACVDRWARAGGRGLLIGLVHLVDLSHVDPVDDVVVDVLDVFFWFFCCVYALELRVASRLVATPTPTPTPTPTTYTTVP